MCATYSGPTSRRALPCVPQCETTVHRRQSIAANVASGTGGFILVTVGDQTVTATDSSVAWLAKSLAAVGQSEDCATDMFGQPRPGTHDAGQVGVAERGSRRRRGQGAVQAR